jgi:uncharacterized protein (DUF1684 family)
VTTPHRPDVERWTRFRAAREAALAEPHGWLSLTSFQWLRPEASPVDLVAGLWSAHGEAASVTATPEDGLTDLATGNPVHGTLTARLEDEESLLWVGDGGPVVVELARRAGRYAIRTRDAASPTLTGFTGVAVFDHAPGYVVRGRFEPYDAPRVDAIRTAHPEVTGEQVSAGDVVLRLPGDDREHRLRAVEEADGTLGITFHDSTNGHTTAGWRKVTAGRPRPDGSVVVDFNRCINYPSAFTPFGTCPMPVEGNTLDAPVEAGERAPTGVR